METASYVVVTPVRNEAKHLQLTIDSMVAQTLRPSRWVIVDDGSTDDTQRIAQAASRLEPWILVVRRPDRGFRQAGGGVMEAFYEGLRSIKDVPWQFLVKLDGDLSFSTDYFEQCLNRFKVNPKLGIGGGTVCNLVEGTLRIESEIDPAFHVRGATKIYRRECWNSSAG